MICCSIGFVLFENHSVKSCMNQLWFQCFICLSNIQDPGGLLHDSSSQLATFSYSIFNLWSLIHLSDNVHDPPAPSSHSSLNNMVTYWLITAIPYLLWALIWCTWSHELFTKRRENSERFHLQGWVGQFSMKTRAMQLCNWAEISFYHALIHFPGFKFVMGKVSGNRCYQYLVKKVTLWPYCLKTKQSCFGILFFQEQKSDKRNEIDNNQCS